jgi:CRISPR system Cascade subunit CasE
MKYFSKVQLDLSQQAARECLLELDHPYREHQLLWQLFPGAVSRNFLFARAAGGAPVYYVVSGDRPHPSSSAWTVETREYRPQLSAGDRLSFRLRANAVVIQKVARNPDQHQAWLENRRAQELPEMSAGKHFPRRIRHDVVMQAKHAIGWKNLSEEQRPPLNELIHRAGLDWLVDRQERNGFLLHRESLQVDGYSQHRFMKKESKPIVFSTLEFQGVLTVTEPADFIEKALFEGIGPAKAFGCGLLLVRRI